MNDAPPFAPRGGVHQVGLPTDVRRLLTVLAAEVAPQVTARDPAAWRLFPTTYGDDQERARAFDEMVAPQLTDSRLGALNLIGRTSTAETLSAEEVEVWMRGLGIMRLVLAESTERRGRAERRAVLDLLAYLQACAVEALDPEIAGDGEG